MAKISPQTKASALQVACVIASSVAVRGTLPDDRCCRNVAITALRFVKQMDQVANLMEEHKELETMPLAEAYVRVHELVDEDEKAAQRAQELEDAKVVAQKTIDDIAAQLASK